MNKKLILSLFLFGLFFGSASTTSLSIMPSEGGVGLDCVEEFSVLLRMDMGQKAIGADLFIDSNMEFVSFEKSDLFKYFPPIKSKTGVIGIALFNGFGTELTNGGVLGKLYFKVNSDIKDPYIKLAFNDVGDTNDTNIVFDGNDLLSFVEGGAYTVDPHKTCVHTMDDIVLSEEESMDEFLEEFNNDHKSEYIRFYIMNHIYILGGGLLVLIVMVLFFFKKKK